ncbi:GtrA family protein [Paenibacillus sp. strain BS8-2]
MSGKGEKGWFLQLVIFGAVGVLNTAIDFGVFGLLTWLSVHYAAAQALSYLAGMLNSYLLNNAITFRSKSGEKARSFSSVLHRQLRFLIWNGAMLALSVGLMSASIRLLDWSEWMAKAVVTIVILGLNFYGSKKWVFTSASRPQVMENGGQS